MPGWMIETISLLATRAALSWDFLAAMATSCSPIRPPACCSDRLGGIMMIASPTLLPSGLRLQTARGSRATVAITVYVFGVAVYTPLSNLPDHRDSRELARVPSTLSPAARNCKRTRKSRELALLGCSAMASRRDGRHN